MLSRWQGLVIWVDFALSTVTSDTNPGGCHHAATMHHLSKIDFRQIGFSWSSWKTLPWDFASEKAYCTKPILVTIIVAKNVFLEGVFLTFFYVFVIVRWLRKLKCIFMIWLGTLLLQSNINLRIACWENKMRSLSSYGGSGISAIFLLADWFISQQSTEALLRLVTPGAEFCGVTLYNV